MPTFDMPDKTHTFEERGGWLVGRYMATYGLQDFQAAGLVGNFGFESEGLATFHERGQPAELGGIGWPQWTGPRRRSYEAWCAKFGLDPDSDPADFGYTVVELSGDYAATIDALRKCDTIDAATWSVGQTYERPAGTTGSNLPRFDGRLQYAKRALGYFRGAGAATSPPGHVPNGPLQTFDVLQAQMRALHTTLIVAGYSAGPVTGKLADMQPGLDAFSRWVAGGMG
jgi:hypothetical protein